MAPDKNQITDAIALILDRGTVDNWEITEIGTPKNRTMVDCKIKHSQAFEQRRFHNVHGFETIEFSANITSDSLEGVKYNILLMEDETQP